MYTCALRAKVQTNGCVILFVFVGCRSGMDKGANQMQYASRRPWLWS